jgi:hypothetical protein
MVQSAGISLLIAAVIWATFATAAPAQGGWRQWDIQLRDGKRVVANPLGAPDDTHLSVSVGGFEGHDSTIARSRIDYIAAQTTVGPNREPLNGAALPPVPTRRSCNDLVARRDGRRTTGRVALARIQYSEGVVKQGETVIDLADVAYIKFASLPRNRCAAQSKTAVNQPTHIKRIP